MTQYRQYFEDILRQIKAEGRYRHFQTIRRQAGDFPHAHHACLDKNIVVWCSNDYLAMSEHPAVVGAMQEALLKVGAGAGGTRNISGTTHYHVALEEELAGLHQKEAALLFTSGYIANMATLAALGRALPDLVILSDAQNHASMIDGIRQSGAEKIIFAHNDPQDLASKLGAIPRGRPKLIAFESVYSMSGDIAPIADFCALAAEYGALTYLDEVHAHGLYGPQGGGIAEAEGLTPHIDIVMGNFGKCYGTMGGYIAAAAPLVDVVRSSAPSFIFTTSLPPALCAASYASVRHLRLSNAERQTYHKNVAVFKEKLRAQGIPFEETPSHIIPIHIGDAARCKALADQLLDEHHIYVQPINYPTVPRGRECLRATLQLAHTESMMDDFVQAVKAVLGK